MLFTFSQGMKLLASRLAAGMSRKIYLRFDKRFVVGYRTRLPYQLSPVVGFGGILFLFAKIAFLIVQKMMQRD